METTTVIAKIWAIYFILISTWCIVMRDTVLQLINKIVQNDEHVFLQGLITLGLGIVLVINYSYWILDWRLMITIVHWSIFIKGLYLLFFPEIAIRLFKNFLQTNKFIPIVVLNSLIGIYFVYFGFIVPL